MGLDGKQTLGRLTIITDINAMHRISPKTIESNDIARRVWRVCGKHGAPGLCGPVRDGVKPRYCTEAHQRMALAKTIGGLTRRERARPLACFCQRWGPPAFFCSQSA